MTNEEIYNILVDEIGVIPQVGRSIVDYIYIIGAIAGILAVLFYAILYNQMMIYVENNAYKKIEK